MARIVLEQKDIEELEKLLVELPFKFAQPIINYIGSKVVQDQPQATEEEGE